MQRRRRELRPATAKRYAWIISNYIAPVVGDLQLTALRAEHLDRLYTDLVDHGGATAGRSPPRPSTTSTSSSAPHWTRHPLPARRQQRRLDAHPPRPTMRSRPSPRSWTSEQLAQFLDRTTICGSTRRFTSPPPPACAAVNSPGFVGPTGSPPRTVSPSAAAAERRRSRGGDPHQDRRQPTLHRPRRHHRTHPPPSGGNANGTTDSRPTPATRCSPTPSATRSTPNRSPSSSTAKSPGSDYPGSASTTFATPTPHCSSPPEHRSRSSPNDSATPTPASRWHTYQHLLPGMGAAAARDFAALIAAAGPVDRLPISHASPQLTDSPVHHPVDAVGRHASARTTQKARTLYVTRPSSWWRGQDLNLRPSGYEPDELPDCSTPRRWKHQSTSGPGD